MTFRPASNVLLPLYLLHRHRRFWKEPERFWPERFAPEHEAERPRFSYMPFAAGPRHCIGETFALYEMLMHLYKVARRYRLIYVPDKPLELEAQINLRTRHPLHMRLEAPLMSKATTLTELIESQPHARARPSPTWKARTTRAMCPSASCTSARSASCITCSASAPAAATS